MSLPVVEHHVADITNVDTTSITFDLPATINAGDGILCVIGSWDDNNSFTLVEDDTNWDLIDTASDDSVKADAMVIGRVADGTEGGTTVTVGLGGATATAIVNVLVISNWWGDFADGLLTVDHTFVANGDSPAEYSSPAITIPWPTGDQHLAIVWSVFGRDGGPFNTTPAGYTVVSNGLISGLNANRGVSVATGYKELVGSSETPGNWASDNNLVMRYAGTIAIRGASTAPFITLDNATLTPGQTISGSYGNFAGDPTGNALVLTDSNGNTLNITVTISDNGDGTGTFTGTMPSLPAQGASAAGLLFGTITADLTDPGA